MFLIMLDRVPVTLPQVPIFGVVLLYISLYSAMVASRLSFLRASMNEKLEPQLTGSMLRFISVALLFQSCVSVGQM